MSASVLSIARRSASGDPPAPAPAELALGGAGSRGFRPAGEGLVPGCRLLLRFASGLTSSVGYRWEQRTIPRGELAGDPAGLTGRRPRAPP